MDKWKAIDLPNIEAEVNQILVDQNMLRREEATNIATTILQRKHQDAVGEVLGRQGFTRIETVNVYGERLVDEIEAKRDKSRKNNTKKRVNHLLAAANKLKDDEVQMFEETTIDTSLKEQDTNNVNVDTNAIVNVVLSKATATTKATIFNRCAANLIGKNVFKSFIIDDNLNKTENIEGTVESFDDVLKSYKVRYEDGDAEDLTKIEVEKIIERYNYWNKKKEIPARKRAREDYSQLQCTCGCKALDNSCEFVSCEHKRNCLNMIHTICKRNNKTCSLCVV